MRLTVMRRRRTLDLLVELLTAHVLAGHRLLAKPLICRQQLFLCEGVGLDVENDLLVERARVIDYLGQDPANVSLICGCSWTATKNQVVLPRLRMLDMMWQRSAPANGVRTCSHACAFMT